MLSTLSLDLHNIRKISTMKKTFKIQTSRHMWFSCSSVGKEPASNAGDQGSFPGSGDPLEKEMATHSSILAWKIPWMEKSGRLQSMRLQRVGLNWATSLSFPVFLPEEFHGQRTHGIARVKQDLVTKPPH